MSKRKTYQELKNRIRELEQQLKNGENREYKSRLFSFLFGREENKKWTLSLYNAIHGTSHSDLSCITINTIEDVVYMGMKNDLSILVSETVSLYQSMELYEQQSTYCPNIPVREFMYAAKLYDKYIYSAKLNRYSKTLLPLPLPKLFVFYNGEDEKEDEITLCLSDAFKEEIRQNILHRYEEMKEPPDAIKIASEAEQIFQSASPDIEVKVRMLNINHGHNRQLLSACRPLGEYAWFISEIRNNLTAEKTRAKSNNKAAGIGDAIDQAISSMPDDFEIKKFITANRAEVKDMCLTEYNEAETMNMLRQEGLEEGRQKGLMEGRQKGLMEGRQKGLMEGRQESRMLDIKNLMESTGFTAENVMDFLKIPSNQRTDFYAGLSQNR